MSPRDCGTFTSCDTQRSTATVLFLRGTTRKPPSSLTLTLVLSLTRRLSADNTGGARLICCTQRGAFNRMDAEGPFKLALSDPVERAIARQLSVNGLRQPKSWTKVKLNGRATPFDSSWATTLPEEGTLEVVHERILGKREIMKVSARVALPSTLYPCWLR